MPVNFLSESERLRLSQFPRDISEADLIQYFRLTQEDINLIQRQRRNFNRLGFAVQLCALRYLGSVDRKDQALSQWKGVVSG